MSAKQYMTIAKMIISELKDDEFVTVNEIDFLIAVSMDGEIKLSIKRSKAIFLILRMFLGRNGEYSRLISLKMRFVTISIAIKKDWLEIPVNKSVVFP